MKKYKQGMILGKFYPPTKGHFYLIESALEQCEKLTVLVCSLPQETIPGRLRHNWIQTQYPSANVIHITQDLPQAPVDDKDTKFWEIWTEVIVQNVKNMDVVFTSELYGDKIAYELNIRHSYPIKIEHVLVDLYRTTVPISGTQIRNNPYGNWDYIPEIVRPFFVKRVALMGPESVGKTVMTKQLAQHYNTNYVLEYGRYYYNDLVKNGDKFSGKDAWNIIHGQLVWEDSQVKSANKLLFCDTEAITTKIWLEVISNEKHEVVDELVKDIEYDLYLLLSPEVEWINDGTRAFGGDVREKQFLMIKSELEKRGLNYKIINGKNYSKRMNDCIREINNLVEVKNCKNTGTF